MRALSILPVIAVVFCVAAPASAIDVKAPEGGWEEANRTDEFVIFTKDDADSGTRKLTAYVDITAPAETVFKVVCDFDNYVKFMPYMKESRILARKGDDELTNYQLISPPLVSERDYVIKVKVTRGPANGGVWKSEWEAKPTGQPEREGVVRVKLNTGSWTMTPLPDGKTTRVTYALHTSPGGSIPSFIANKSNTVAIPDLFKAVKERSAWELAQKKP